MEKLQLPHAKLFYFSAELYKNHTITENEKLKLKEMVINDEPQVFELLERYQANGNETEFVNGLLSLLRPHQRQLFQPQTTQQDQGNYKQRTYEPEQHVPPQPIVQQQPKLGQQDQGRRDKFSNNTQQQPENQESNINNQEPLNPNNEEIAQFIEKHPDCPDEISSPLGLKLLKRKQKAQKANPQVKDYLKPYKIDQE
ncbi:hypothetical protein TTHERM_00780650 (macronuclear) [Tetrahymena thermophila SB210]|uniref:Uncharacterized protein n=1 Tax=Tetrahymena thermophila (strain SB210) TaxID=312017 RepID=I7LXR3_TETTS|nr:hypothetical protein TTHERM_00780650 [Tetrahymena thermophila SB210]EAS05976.2 hypothetical protein TTHERM_00780650 [Tetrahymena thermophila SB210]|eukprot:XP_001026221.2 hypothetical protein TTHERM_00780650 [Tetrahymena thermophila SB210]